MKLFIHYCLYGFSNCYILGSDPADADEDGVRDCLIIDPGCMDEKMLAYIENRDYRVRGILITHDHANHVHGLRTLKRIYSAEIFAGDPTVYDERATIVRDGETLRLGPFEIMVYSVPGHSSDSVAYRIGRLLFTGDALSAGLVGATASAYGRSILADALTRKILTLPGELMVMPGHGPPTTVEAERRFNAGLEASKHAGLQRAAFVRDIW